MNERLITAEMLEELPEPVQRYLTQTGLVGKPWIDTVHLKQTGRFRMGRDRPWMPMTGEQYYTTNPPSFLWDARFKIAGLPLIRARDRYESGRGHMYGKVAGLFTVFDVRGEELDQGTMIRYLNEMMWFPSAYLGSNITWEAVDDDSAKVTFTDNGKSVNARMFFDEVGRLTDFTAMRYREIEGEFSLDPWSTPITDYGVCAGLDLPVKGHALWKLPDGDLIYTETEIIQIEYNSPP
ncbi:MAG: hypothetical protein GTO18_19075 [Anaerolineales bacterium]|nr:hypothetical protein [Anaerolineales bacterium]